MHIHENLTKEELLDIIVLEEDISLYRKYDEQRLLHDGYTQEELYKILCEWIEEGDECPVIPTL